MQQELMLVFIMVYALDSIVPGPAVAMVMSRGVSIGLMRTLPLIAGLVIGDIFLFLFALLGLAAAAAALGPFFVLIKWIGILYLLYLACQTWNAALPKHNATTNGAEGWRSFGLGIVLPLGNPKAVGFYAALLPTVMDVNHLSVATALKFTAAILIIWGAVLIFYTAIADKGRKHYNNSSVQKWMNRAAAGAMAGAAGTIAFRE